MQERKKILYLVTKGNFGGAQRYVYDLATNLPKDQFEVVVSCGEGEILKEKLEQKEIRVIELKSFQRDISLIKDIKTFFEILKIIRTEKPSILSVSSSKAGGLGTLAGRILKTQNIIFTAHGWAFNEERSFISKIVITLLHWITVILSHQTIAVSEKTKNDLSWMPFINQKIKTVHNGIANFDTLPKEEARVFLAKNRDGVILISLAELHKNKGVDIALKGISLLPENIKSKILYCVAGTGEEKANLEKLADDLNIKNQVVFLGFVDNAKQYLTGADIFLFPSRNENLPFAVLEAGLAGLPIIATSVGGIPEIIRDMQNGILVHPRNPKEIAEAILYLLDHQEKQKEFGEEIKKTITNFFSLEKMLNETINLYN